MSMQNNTIFFVLQETSAPSQYSLRINGWIFIARSITVLEACVFKR